MRDLQGKVAVVTGAASGIGRALTDRFVAAGMKVVLADVDEVKLRAAEAELAEGGADVHPVVADVSLGESMEELARRTLEKYGAAHVLCNNAGVAGVGDQWTGPMSVWEWVVNINLYGVVHGIRSFLPIMLDQNDGHIVNTASMAGLVAMPGFGPYNATKHAVVAISEGLFLELGAKGVNVSCSCLCPGFVKTNLMNDIKWSDRLGEKPRDIVDPISAMMNEALHVGVETGIPATDVAEQVLDAIVTNRFWILTHPDFRSAPVERMQRAAAQENPSLG
ncbi:MAG: SDR family NAD(P)-dependent oxidoreductase [Actinomycetota bacterium]|jgi:NAD(P)-dependent dehydrogenase (short-subunit alcohol dehydrogenase family)